MEKGKVIVIVAPSGTGKSTLIKRLQKAFPQLRGVVTYTTRPIRSNETNGEDYHFVDLEKFEKLKAEEFFIEWAKVHGNFYGSSKESVHDKINIGENTLLEIDVQGAKAYMEEFKDNAKVIFLSPPSMEILEERLRGRGTETDDVIEVRLETAREEMKYRDAFDFLIINDDIDRAFNELRDVVERIIE